MVMVLRGYSYMSKFKYVKDLDKGIFDKLSIDLYAELSEMGLERSELEKAHEEGLNSKLIDLEDTLDIAKYI